MTQESDDVEIYVDLGKHGVGTKGLGGLIRRFLKKYKDNGDFKILPGDINLYQEAVIETLRKVESDYHQLTISPALFQADSEQRYRDYHDHIKIIAKSADIHLSHIEENFLVNDIFKYWLVKSKQSRAEKSLTLKDLRRDYEVFKQLLVSLSSQNKNIFRPQIMPLASNPAQPLAFLISVANRKIPTKTVALIVAFKFENSIRTSHYKGFYTENSNIAQIIDNILEIYVNTKKHGSVTD